MVKLAKKATKKSTAKKKSPAKKKASPRKAASAKKFKPGKPKSVAPKQLASLESVSFNMCEHDASDLVMSKKKGLSGSKPKSLTNPNIVWRVCKALEQLRAQINVAAPNRKKDSDGGIGDIAHWHKGSASDHNPWISDGPNKGVVTARDFTHHKAGGCDCAVLVASLVAAKDSRIKYIIWDSVIYNAAATNGAAAWEGRPYTGSNKHNKHAHISVKSSKANYDDTSAWTFKLT
jgi:hypothetical protein